MICFRVVDAQWSSAPDLLNGIGASTGFGGRWNTTGIRTVYTGVAHETAIAEKSFYAMRQAVEVYNQQLLTTKGQPAHYLKQIVNRPFKIATIKVHSTLTTANLTDQNELTSHLASAGLPNRSITEARKSNFQLFPDRWTQKLGLYLFQKNFQAIRVASARSDVSDGCAIFSEKIKPEEIEVTNVTDVTLSAVTLSGNKYTGHHPADVNAIHFQFGLQQGTTPVLHVP